MRQVKTNAYFKSVSKLIELRKQRATLTDDWYQSQRRYWLYGYWSEVAQDQGHKYLSADTFNSLRRVLIG